MGDSGAAGRAGRVRAAGVGRKPAGIDDDASALGALFRADPRIEQVLGQDVALDDVFAAALDVGGGKVDLHDVAELGGLLRDLMSNGGEHECLAGAITLVEDVECELGRRPIAEATVVDAQSVLVLVHDEATVMELRAVIASDLSVPDDPEVRGHLFQRDGDGQISRALDDRCRAGACRREREETEETNEPHGEASTASTMPRGATPEEDERNRQFLLNDPKNQAENRMIVDLLRNDISRISEVGTLDVPELFRVESYPTVHQMVSRIRARLLPGSTLLEILAALFPCGSVTGAPKISAMKILRSLEVAPRDVYCGAIGWVAPDGRMRFNVAIRTISLYPGGEAVFNVGGGVVFDSTAEAEYQECLLKARFTDADLT